MGFWGCLGDAWEGSLGLVLKTNCYVLFHIFSDTFFCLHFVDPQINLKINAVCCPMGPILSGYQCPSVSSQRLARVFGYGVRKGVGELCFWGAPGVAFASPWANTGSPLEFLGSPWATFRPHLDEKSMEKIDAAIDAEGVINN